MSQLGFAVNADSCTGCKACVAACEDLHDLPVGAAFRRVLTAEAGSWRVEGRTVEPVGVFAYSISISCNHCAQPVCMRACKQEAISKDAKTGIVLIDGARCKGCGRCAKACPYDAPVILPDGKAHKCDLCVDRLAKGEEPACAAACMMRCLRWGEMGELRATFGGSPEDDLLPAARRTQPSLSIVPHRLMA